MKTKTMFVCQNCGAQSPRWQGKCTNCDSWNSFVEEAVVEVHEKNRPSSGVKDDPVLLTDVALKEEKRFLTGMNELDRVLGGGVVPSSVILIGGDPGIGKSTLSLQIACALSQKGHKVLYVSGEESVAQTRLRSQRLLGDGKSFTEGKINSLYIVNQLDLNVILEYLQTMKPDVVIIDSIEVIYDTGISSSPGSVSQVRECAAILTQTAKTTGTALFIIGHVTKEGMLAGPRVLEHIVDTVLYFEGERYLSYRVLRATKNRFGSTNEIGVFEMTSSGLVEVVNPSEIFLSERPKGTAGSVVVPIMEGTRPFLVEIQGLVSRSCFGMPRQKAQGYDANRLALLVAVLDKKIGLNLQDKDIFLNIAGGVRVMDPSADLGVALAVASAFLDKAIGFDTAVIGEVGLSSEVRSVAQIAARINEAGKLGFKKCIIPHNNMKTAPAFNQKEIEVIAVDNVKQAMGFLG